MNLLHMHGPWPGLLVVLALVVPAAEGAPPRTGSDGSIRMGQKNVELASVELDTTCARLVTPMEVTDNVAELSVMGAQLMAKSAGQSLASFIPPSFGGSSNTRSPSAKQAKQQRHQINEEVRRAAVRMNWLPMATEVLYGQHLLSQMDRSLMKRDSGIGRKLYPKADALLAQVLAGVGEPHAYNFEMHISTNSGDNAMALPGGFVVLDKALIDNPALQDKAYFALSHEVAHVLQRHETRAAQARIVDAVSLRGALPDLLKTMRQAHQEPAAVVATVLAGKLLFEKHFENQELQSDACAVRLLDSTLKDDQRVRASIQAFVNGLAPIETAEATKARRSNNKQPSVEELGDIVELVSRPIDRHPGTEVRVKNLRVMLETVRQGQARPAAPVPAPVLSPPATSSYR